MQNEKLKTTIKNLKLLIATHNTGKLLEYEEIFKNIGLKIKLVSLKDLGVTQKLEETGNTFEENAIQKAKFYYNLAKMPTLADDSGLEIDYLNGEPGIKSRRWSGYEASDEEMIQIALDKLTGVSREQRGAQLRAVVALIFPGDEKAHTFEGVLRGSIAEKPISERIAGYPFRSIFVPEHQQKYLGELSLVAHRMQAIENALPVLLKYFDN
ncbi:MAG: non-canonical purine NTP pyrophosphatase [Candidatus Nealsonbacteria bacterium]|nr:MAG: non-canonical purine NTP pyrophosphatase [Candidatus Nealsonbacteria bacterium]